MISLYRDPTGQSVLSETGTTSVVSNAAGLNLHWTNQEREREFMQMQERIAALEGRLRQYEVSYNNILSNIYNIV